MNNNKIKKQILEEFLKSILIISDKEYQKRVWIKGSGPEVNSFDETVCDFFDLGEYIFSHPQNYDLTENQLSLLIKFRKQFKSFADENDFPTKFIDTSDWNEITQFANDVLFSFNYKKQINNSTIP